MKDNFLTDIDSYNTSFKSHNDSIKTLKSVLDLHNSNHSKPIERKVHQDIIVPYWIIINEMTFGVVINCIKNLKSNFSELIYENLIKEFTNKILSFSNSSDKYNIENFQKILDYIGSFRNMLAHNQPIFTYNIRDDSLCNYPIFTYSQPQINKKNYEKVMDTYHIDKDSAILKCQQSKNNHMKTTCELLFGKDNFNMDKNPSNMNLSYLIYFIYKINLVLDADCTMKQELMDIFYNYNIVDHTDRYYVAKIDVVSALLKKVSDIEFDRGYNSFVNDIRNHNNLKKIQNDITTFKTSINELKSLASSIKKEIIIRRFDMPFSFDNAYQKYTGINAKFLKNL
jgi:hypothetical protein